MNNIIPLNVKQALAGMGNSKARLLNKSMTLRELLFIGTLIICVTPWVSPPVALLIGTLVARLIGHPFLHLNAKAIHLLLQLSVIGLGFGMDMHSALIIGKQGFLFTAASIFSTLTVGLLAGRILKIESKTSHLISCGTAICGGSAIAAISPVIRAEEKQISVAVGTIFILNSVALFTFPYIGHLLNLTQSQFGLWAAIAIHDTSAVVGAASKYGSEALQIATTVKLARALWIIPVALITGSIFKSRQKVKIPWFIALFVLAMAANTYIPVIDQVGPYLVQIGKTGLTITLFLIGAGLSDDAIKATGIKPLIQGILLWLFIASTSLYLVWRLA